MQKVHFIGIAGVGMSAVALLLKEAGWQVSGSDAEVYGPPRDVLSRGGIPFVLGYRPENIPSDTDCFVIGRNAKLAPDTNAEVRAALATGKPVYSFPKILGDLTQYRRTLVVAGSYGKSTVTALVAHILRHAGTDAGYFIGAEPVQSTWLPAPATIGSEKIFIVEGDEYPSSHNDSQAKFMHLHPKDVLLTSVVHDHVNVYPTFADYQQPFRNLLALVPEDGIVVVCADEEGALTLAQESNKKLLTYGVQNTADFRAERVHYGEHTVFDLIQNGHMLGQIETPLLGTHNVENIVGAAAYFLSRKLISFEQVKSAVRDFKGVRRRLDNMTPNSSVPVFEGFGSSYEKASAAIDAIRLHFPTRPLVIVFEPHTFGWRNRANLTWYDDVFSGAATVFVAPPAEQGAATHAQLSHEEILSRIGDKATSYGGPEAVLDSLTGNEVVLVLTSGDLGGTLSALPHIINKKFS
jgi:UDP-N-acetylmuramate: L-alanyl-gamma-D-glutamyl-meso-diaminopimelate ligase